MIDLGRSQYRNALNSLAYCLNEDKFPGYESRISDLTLPAWAKTSSLELPLF